MKFIYALVLTCIIPTSFASLEQKIKLLKDPQGKAVKLGKEDVISLERFENMFSMEARTPGLQVMLKRHAFRHKEKAVPVLIRVMKDGNYPEQNRWHATMLLAQVMGPKAAPFIAKFTEHPHWMMRVASLKALLGLKQSDYHAVYSRALRDPSLIVRIQALDNISQLKVTKLAPEVWNMLYDQSNYTGEKGARKRTSIVKAIIRTIGDVKYLEAKPALVKLIQKPKYQDLMDDLDYSLEKLTGEVSPNSAQARRQFWAKK
jgi:HEAT repeat protein